MKYCLSTAFSAALFFTHTASAEIIYDNSTNFEGKFNNTRLEAGDQLDLAGTQRLVTDVAFEYFASFTPNGDETARVRIYANDGPALANGTLPTPGTLLYDSGSFGIEAGYRTIEIHQMSLLVPGDTLIFTVQFAGLAGTEKAGLLNYNPPTVGQSGNFYWQKQNDVWEPVASANTSNNFSARVIAVDAPVPLRILSIRRQNGVSIIEVNATAGKYYALQYKTTVQDPAWQTLGNPLRASEATVTLRDASASASMRIYRVAETAVP